MKKIYFVFILIFFSINLFGQEKNQIPLDKNETWNQFIHNDIISLSVKYADCSDPSNGIYRDYYFLRLENNTDSTVLVDWHYDLYYDGECTTCVDADNEFLFRYELSPREIIEPNCDNFIIAPPYQLGIFRSIIDMPQTPKLTDAKISNLITYTY